MSTHGPEGTAVFIAKSGGILAQIHPWQEGPIGEACMKTGEDD